MVSPAPVNPPDSMQTTAHAPGSENRFLRTYGFHLLVVILGIALAFM